MNVSSIVIVDQSAVTNASDKLPLALVTAFARHKQQNGESCVYKFILFFQFKVTSLFNWFFSKNQGKRGMLID